MPTVDNKLSRRVETMVAAIREPFMSFSRAFSALNQSRSELAPRFMKAFGGWQAETGGTFVAFVKVLDPSIPDGRDGYRSHPSYNAANYLRTLAGRGGTATEANRASDTVVATANDALARTIASLLLLIPDGERPKVFDIIGKETGWTDRQLSGLERRAEHADPIVMVKANRGVALPLLKVTSPTHSATSEAA